MVYGIGFGVYDKGFRVSSLESLNKV